MDYRHGTCTSCKKSYRVPATFTADHAKCRECGGTVVIGAVGAAPPKTAESKAAEPPGEAPPPRAAAPARTESVRAAAETAAKRVKTGAAARHAEPAHAAHPAPHGHADAHGHPHHHLHHAKKNKSGMQVTIISIVVIAVLVGAFVIFGGQKDAPPPVVDTRPKVDPAYDLGFLPAVEKPAGYSKLDWDDIRQSAFQYPRFAHGSEAEKAQTLNLTSRPKNALPAVLCEVRLLNLTRDFDSLERYQHVISEMLGGRTFGWKAKTEPGYLDADKAYFEQVFAAYKRALEEPAYFEELLRPEGAPPEGARAPAFEGRAEK